MTSVPGLERLERTVTLNRRKGDALARRGNIVGAVDAYQTALTVADEAFAEIGIATDGADVAATLKPEVAGDAAEWLGVRGGLLRRIWELDKTAELGEALRSYRLGAKIESEFDLPGTYNRLNAVKLALISGQAKIEEERPELLALRAVLDRRLATDEQAADDAWTWADLGDLLLLLREDEAAVSAYATFAEKARTDSPAATLGVLRQIVDALKEHDDPDAASVEAALDRVQALLRPL
jgi:tetratricopeptide (TPR) repeat protein